MYENVIRFPNQNTLNTNTKQIKNPQKEISGGFFYEILYPLEIKFDGKIKSFSYIFFQFFGIW